ncbi:MAG: hypothetical protein WA125_06245 [Desulfosporosinus sp.]
MLTERVPPWIREDLAFKTTNDETEKIKLESYEKFQQILPKQPNQLWPVFKRKTYSFEGTVWNGNNTLNLDLNGSYPLAYDFTIAVGDTTLNAPVFICSKEVTMEIRQNLLANSIIDIHTNKTIQINDTELYVIDDVIQNGEETIMTLGKSSENERLRQTFVPNYHGLREIELKFGPSMGNPSDDIVIELYKDGTLLDSKLIDNDVLMNNRNLPLKIGFDINLIAGEEYYIEISRTGDLTDQQYYTIYTSSAVCGNLKSFNEEWETKTGSIYFITRTQPLFAYRNVGKVDDKYTITYTPNDRFTSYSFLLGKIIGNPTSDLTVKLSLGEDLVETQTLKADELLEKQNQEIVVNFLNEYPPGEYTIEIFNQFSDSENYYTLTTFENIYPSFEPPTDTIDLFCSNCPDDFMQEAHGIIFSGTTIGVELDKIGVRAFSQGIYPLKSVRVFIERESSVDMIEEALFNKTLHQRCFFTEIKNENIASSISSLPFNMYMSTEYWGLQEQVETHFPTTEATQNQSLDEIGKLYGIFRRKYLENIVPQHYAYTYPIGYPWEDEQDYWFEKRILNEYATREDKNEKITLYEYYQIDIPHKPILELTTKSAGIHSIEITIGKKGQDCDDLCAEEVIQRITIVDTDIQGIIQTEETFIYRGDPIELVDDINFGSELIEATYLNSTHEALETGTLFLNTEGTYQNYGLIKAEINQYLGVIPLIKDMSDYCLIWDEKEWDKYVWAGDKWDAGVFELQIPVHKIPKNFKLLTIHELELIINRCKAFGTRVLPMYSYEGLLRAEFNVEFQHAEFIYELPEIEFESIQADMYAAVTAKFNVAYGGAEGGQSARFNLGFNLEFEVARLIDQSILLIEGGNTHTTSTPTSITIDQSNPFKEGFPHGVWGSGWVDVMNMLTYADGYNASWFNQEGELQGYDMWSDYLHLHTFNLNIPLDATITGIGVSAWIENTTGDTTHAVVMEGVGGGQRKDLWDGGQWSQVWWGWNNDLWGRSDLTPAIVNRTDFGFAFQGWVRRQRRLSVNKFYIAVWYKYKSGNYVTTRIVSPTLPAGYDVGHWDAINCTETKPSGTSIKYDVFEDIVDKQQTLSNNNHPFGQGLYTEVYQSFVPTASWLTGVWVKTGNPSKVGNPSGNIRIIIRENNGGTVIAYRDIPKANWVNNTEIFVPFDINLTIGKEYWICWYIDGGFDNSNYYQMAYYNQAISGKMGVYESGIGWKLVNGGKANACFKTLRGNNLLTNQNNPINITALPFQTLRLKAKLVTNTAGITPEITSILAKAKVINL